MIKTLEKTGRTEDDAINAALAELGLDRDDVSVEILERAKSGFLGIGASPAVVRVSYEAEDEPAPAEENVVVETVEVEVSAPVVDEPADYAAVRQFLTGLLDRMGVKANIAISARDNGGINVELSGSGMGAIIGRRGETLDAIQHLTNYAINRGQNKRVRINVDAESYRLKREQALQRLAQKVAGKVTRYRRNITLEPMNAYERHVIHAALQDHPDVTTFSTGTEPNRRIVVAYSRYKSAEAAVKEDFPETEEE